MPLKLKVNLDALDPSKALPYTTCFNVGDWYYTGPENPGSPPSDGVPTCVVSNSIATSLNADPCWGKCREDDVLTPDLAAFFRTSLDAAVSRLERAIRVPELAPLRLNARLELTRRYTVISGDGTRLHLSAQPTRSTCVGQP